MTRDELYKMYDGPIPQDIRIQSQDVYYKIFVELASRRLTQRCFEIVRSITAWRVIDRYPEEIKETMLIKLQRALLQSRTSGAEAFDMSSGGMSGECARI